LTVTPAATTAPITSEFTVLKSFSKRLGTTLAVAVVILFTVLSLWYGSRAAWSDASALHARWLVNGWRDDKGLLYNPNLWREARDDLQAALQITPNNAQLLDDLGFLHAARAQGLGTPTIGSLEFALQQNLLTDAIFYYRTAAGLRPTFPYSLAYLALSKHLRGERDSEFWLAFDKALRYGHTEAGVQPALAQIAFANWSEVGTKRQGQIISMVAGASSVLRKRLVEMAAKNGVMLTGQ
jgi:tetratricopeptide (TPR) repeat protein